MRGVGRLSVRVYATQAEIPIQGATVVVTCRGRNGKNDLISVQSTDSSGRIRTVELGTPMPAESTEPVETGEERSFSVCTVWAEHPEYAMLQVSGVQIFPGVETVQDMELIPLAEGQDSLQQRGNRQIAPQNL